MMLLMIYFVCGMLFSLSLVNQWVNFITYKSYDRQTYAWQGILMIISWTLFMKELVSMLLER